MRRELEKAESGGKLMTAEKENRADNLSTGERGKTFLLTQLHPCVFGQDVVPIVTQALNFSRFQKEMLSSKGSQHCGSQNPVKARLALAIKGLRGAYCYSSSCGFVS